MSIILVFLFLGEPMISGILKLPLQHRGSFLNPNLVEIHLESRTLLHIWHQVLLDVVQQVPLELARLFVHGGLDLVVVAVHLFGDKWWVVRQVGMAVVEVIVPGLVTDVTFESNHIFEIPHWWGLQYRLDRPFRLNGRNGRRSGLRNLLQ